MASEVQKYNTGKIGVLLINLGTPDGYDKKNMRRYLAEFLSDPRIVERSRWIWYPVLYGIILTTRPKKSGELYRSIWNHDRDESPLRTYSRSQGKKLAERLQDLPNVVVEWGMRYGTPSIKERLEQLKEKGCDRIAIFPLYPQYSATTTASVCDKSFSALSAMRWMPAIRTVPVYYDHPVYIKALANSILAHLKSLDFEPEKVITSFHGIPKSYSDKGDPYYGQCLRTSELLQAELGWEEGRLITCFQSLFGPEEWLKPYFDKTLEELAADGVRNIAVINPGFVSDCVETLEEIAIEGAETFKEAGGEKFSHIPCLNDDEDGMQVIETVVRKELQGWV